MKRFIIIALVLGFAGFGYAADGDYTIPDGQVVADPDEANIVIELRGYLRELRQEYTEIQAEIDNLNRLLHNQVTRRDAAIAEGQRILALRADKQAEKQALVDKYQALRAAVEAAVTVEGE